ncbi:hypothetical protein [Frankia sp. Cj5]|uniref:hypothetical protein n=1 Tax=Frankia sp. Cj5 TaxID=2880978 RepID=UPI001EF49F30|nr:hypothetical protein [Frankia sp. Cj5]
MAESADFESSVFSDMKPFTWDSKEVAAYEAALEAGHAAVGAYAARITAEENKLHPDPARLERWKNEQVACARARDTLDPADPAAVAEARIRFTDIAHQIQEQA